MKFAKGVVLEIPESIKTSNSRVARERELWWQDLTRCCSAEAAHRLPTLEAIRMVCVFSPGLWQPNACDSETDYDDVQAIRAHESCITSEYILPLFCVISFSLNLIRCLWTTKSVSFSANNGTAGSDQIADFLEDVIHLRNVEPVVCVDFNSRSLEVRKGVMDGNAVALRELKFTHSLGIKGGINNVSLLIYSSNKM